MSINIACIAGEEIYRQWDAGRIAGQLVGRRNTPFGPSGEIFLVEGDGEPFYLLSRYGAGMAKTSPQSVNYRANMYAIKELGVRGVLAWGPAGAITHDISVGDLVIAGDVIDMTGGRPTTFFENSPLGFLRQFPVFCPGLRAVAADVLTEMKLSHHNGGVIAVRNGPRLETPAEIRMLATAGAELVAHTFVPEVFLAKELQLCYAALACAVNYAETGSKHRPFAAGELFAGLSPKGEAEHLAGVAGSMMRIVRNISTEVAKRPATCECSRTMLHNVKTYNLSEDWRQWFSQ